MRPEKQYLGTAVADPIDQHGAFVILSYSEIPANTLNQFRRDVASLGGLVKMTKKRIILKAFESKGIDVDISHLPGHIGIVFGGNDPIETAKLAFKFSKETDAKASVVGGRIEGKMYSGQDVEMLSKLPSKDEMRAQFLATLEAPMAQTLAVMEALLSSVVYCLDNKSKSEQ